MTRLLRPITLVSALSMALTLLLYMLPTPSQANVTLTSFTATARDGRVLIRWATATEIDTAGFFVRRSTLGGGGYVRISPFIPSRGDALIGSVYMYVDTDVQNGVTYLYMLEIVASDQTVEFHGPISAILWGVEPLTSYLPVILKPRVGAPPPLRAKP